jgi:hypothetical protein
MSDPLDLSLEAPSAYLFTGEICTRAYKLKYGLSEREKALVRARDWTALVASGGHHFNVIKIAAAVGESHLHVGAHMCGASWKAFKRTLPHRVDVMPEDLDWGERG